MQFLNITNFKENIGLQNVLITIVSKAIGFLLGIFAVKVFSQTEYGQYSYLVLILSYLPMFQLGIFQGMYLEYPRKKVESEDDGFSFFSDNSLITIIINLIISLLIFFLNTGLEHWVLVGIIANFVFERFIENKYIHLSVNVEFLKLNLIKMAREIGTPLLRMAILFSTKSLSLFLLAPLAINLLVLPFVFLVHRPSRLSLSSNLKEHVHKAFKIGFPAFILVILDLSFQSVDRVFISQFYSIELLGAYSFLFTLSNTLYLLMFSYLTPKIQILWNTHAEGKNEEVLSFFRMMNNRTLKFTILLFVLIGGGYPILINFIVKKHFGNELLFYSLLLASAFYCLNLPNTNYLLALKKAKVLIKLQLEAFVLNIAMNVYFSINQYPVTYFSFATLITMALMFIRTKHYINKMVQQKV